MLLGENTMWSHSLSRQQGFIITAPSTDSTKIKTSSNIDLVVRLCCRIDGNYITYPMQSICHVKLLACVHRTPCALKQLEFFCCKRKKMIVP